MTTARVTGFKSVAGLGKLTGTDLSAAVPTIAKFCRIDRFEWQTIHGLEEEPSVVYHTPEEDLMGPIDTRFTIEGALYSEGALELILLSLFGDVTTTGTADPRTHTYTVADTPAASKAYMGLETHLGASNKSLQANVGVERVEVRWGQNSYAKFLARGIGSKPVLAAKTAESFPAGGLPFPGKHRATLTVDGVSSMFVEDAMMWWEHTRFPKGYDGVTRERKSAEYLDMKAGIEATVLYDDAAGLDVIEKAWDADGATSPNTTAAKAPTYAASLKLQANPSGAEDSLKSDLVKAVLSREGNPVPSLQGRDLLRQKITATARHNATKAVEAILLNSTTAP